MGRLAEFLPPLVIIASNSPRRIAATNQLVSPGSIEYISGGIEREQLPVHQIAKDKITSALALLATRHGDKHGTVLAADVKVAPMLPHGLDLQSKPQSEDDVLGVICGMMQAASECNPYYTINAGFAWWEGNFHFPHRNHVETRIEHAAVILNREKLQTLSTLDGFTLYKNAISYTELSPSGNHNTSILDISGGLSLAALTYLDVVDSLVIGDREICRYIEGTDTLNPAFIDAFKKIYFMQAVGFSPELLNRKTRRNNPYSSIENALANWEWLNRITKRVFRE